MTEFEYDCLLGQLRREAATWFNNESITALERLISYTDHLRKASHHAPKEQFDLGTNPQFPDRLGLDLDRGV